MVEAGDFICGVVDVEVVLPKILGGVGWNPLWRDCVVWCGRG